ncbi:MAG: hypothetical protein WCY19_04965 [Candidatus Gastranaerophilaceae bacterium]
MYVEIKENKLLSWCEKPYLDYVHVDIDYSTFDPLKYEVYDGELVDISDTAEYKAKIAQAEMEALSKQFISTSLGYLKKATAVGDLLSIFNTYSIIVNRQCVLPAGVLLIYQADKSSAYNEEMTAEAFNDLFDEVTAAYLSSFKGI